MLSGSLYHYFTSKEEIVDAIISSYLDDLRLRYRDAIENVDDPIEQLRALIHASFHWSPSTRRRARSTRRTSATSPSCLGSPT